MDFPLPSIGAAVASGSLGSEQAVQACLERIERYDPELRSFVCLRAEAALQEARALDNEPPRGPLHGMPFAAKDVFDTADLPTEYFCRLYRGFQPARDASLVSLLRLAGAVLLGKTATVELASVGDIPETRNPHHPGHTPGGSSAGSGAAVGAGLVPLALATQTGGSTIRPAAFCGAAGMKPTWGRLSTEGVKPYAPSLDTVGWIAEDVALLQRTAAALGLLDAPGAGAGTGLRIGLYRTPWWDEAEAATRAALERAAGLLQEAGHAVTEVSGPPGSERLNQWQDVVMHGEGCISFQADYRRAPDLLGQGIREEAENLRGISAADLRAALDHIAALRPQFDALLADYDAWLAPSVPGEAPERGPGTGLATYNRAFTALHLPCVHVPGFTGPQGLPVGVQLVGARNTDHRVLAAASILEALISAD